MNTTLEEILLSFSQTRRREVNNQLDPPVKTTSKIKQFESSGTTSISGMQLLIYRLDPSLLLENSGKIQTCIDLVAWLFRHHILTFHLLIYLFGFIFFISTTLHSYISRTSHLYTVYRTTLHHQLSTSTRTFTRRRSVWIGRHRNPSGCQRHQIG